MAALAKLLIGSALGLFLFFSIAPAQAEQVKQSAKEKVNWYSAPREMQVIDDRPMVKDFRSLPKQELTIEIPNQPNGAASGGKGAGCVDSGSSETIPRGGIHLGNQQVAYRGARDADASTTTQSINKPATSMHPANTFNPQPMNLPRPPKGSLLRHGQPM